MDSLHSGTHLFSHCFVSLAHLLLSQYDIVLHLLYVSFDLICRSHLTTRPLYQRISKLVRLPADLQNSMSRFSNKRIGIYVYLR